MFELRSFIDTLNRNKEQIVDFLAVNRNFFFKLNKDKKNASIVKKLEPFVDRDRFVQERIIQLYLLHSTLYRLIEDFNITSAKDLNLVYAIDSSEFQAYVDPEELIQQYIFKIENDNLAKAHLLDKAKQRKYQLEVLFGKKLVASENELDHILYPAFNHEIFAYKQFLVKKMLRNPMRGELTKYLNAYKPKGESDIEKAANFVSDIKEEDNKFINVFVKQFVEQTNKLQRFKDIFSDNRNFREPKFYDWKKNVFIPDSLVTKISEIDYNERIFAFFYSVLKRFDLNRSEDSLIIDCKALAYICTINIFLRQQEIPKRVTLLSSSSLINIFTMSIINFFEHNLRFKNNAHSGVRDIIYVRYPTLLFNQIRFTDKEEKSDETSKHKILFKLVDSLFRKMSADVDYKKGEKIKAEHQSDLEKIKKDWSQLRENLIIEQNLKDTKEKSDQNFSSKEDQKLFEAINNIGFENLYKAVHTLNSEIIEEVLERYLMLNAEKLSIDFHARVEKIDKNGKGKVRYLISSLNIKTCQNVFQIPKEFIDKDIIIKSSAEDVYNFDIEKLKKFDYSENDHLMIYANILCSALLRDWTIVEIVTQKFIEDYKDSEAGSNLMDEVRYINHLANRGILYNNRSRIEFQNEKALKSELVQIEQNLDNTIKQNPNNPLIQLCKRSFDFERAVIEILNNKILTFTQARSNKYFDDFFKKEYIDNQFYKDHEYDFKDHPFKDNLNSMYFKFLLAFYIYCKVTFQDINDENIELLEARSKEYLEKLKIIVDAAYKNDKKYPEKRCLTNYVVEISEQILSSNFDYNSIYEKSKKIRKNSFFGKFILQKSLFYIKQESENYPIKQ